MPLQRRAIVTQLRGIVTQWRGIESLCLACSECGRMSCLHGEWLYAAGSGRGGVYRVGRTLVPGSDKAGMRSQSVTVGITIWGLVNDFLLCCVGTKYHSLCYS